MDFDTVCSMRLFCYKIAFAFLLSDSYLEGKKGLDTVGSVQTVQAVGPNGSTLSPKKT